MQTNAKRMLILSGKICNLKVKLFQSSVRIVVIARKDIQAKRLNPSREKDVRVRPEVIFHYDRKTYFSRRPHQ
jgi:hypothetical protein